MQLELKSSIRNEDNMQHEFSRSKLMKNLCQFSYTGAGHKYLNPQQNKAVFYIFFTVF